MKTDYEEELCADSDIDETKCCPHIEFPFGINCNGGADPEMCAHCGFYPAELERRMNLLSEMTVGQRGIIV